MNKKVGLLLWYKKGGWLYKSEDRKNQKLSTKKNSMASSAMGMTSTSGSEDTGSVEAMVEGVHDAVVAVVLSTEVAIEAPSSVEEHGVVAVDVAVADAAYASFPAHRVELALLDGWDRQKNQVPSCSPVQSWS